MARLKNAPHVNYAKQIGKSVGLRHAQNGEAKYTSKEMTEHYQRAFGLPMKLEFTAAQLKELPFNRTELAKDMNEYRKALNAFKSGYNFGYRRGKEGYKGFADHLTNPVTTSKGDGWIPCHAIRVVGDEVQMLTEGRVTNGVKSKFKKAVSKLKRAIKK